MCIFSLFRNPCCYKNIPSKVFVINCSDTHKNIIHNKFCIHLTLCYFEFRTPLRATLFSACAIKDCSVPPLRFVTTALTLSCVLSLHLPAQTQIRTSLRATLVLDYWWFTTFTLRFCFSTKNSTPPSCSQRRRYVRFTHSSLAKIRKKKPPFG